ncbi:MAG: N-formylglutamate amidohydrolase [bacterium]
MSGKEADNKSDFSAPTGTEHVIELIRPREWLSPFIFTSPHSGRRYPGDFLSSSRLSLLALRRSEDSYVDLLIDGLPRLGVPLLKAQFPRVLVDVNRAADELDPLLFDGPLPPEAETRSTRVLAGFGVIPRLSADGAEIYTSRLPLTEAGRRLQRYYYPWHETLNNLVRECQARFGCAIIIDCHSMPSRSVTNGFNHKISTDFVLGDRYGKSCSPALTGLTYNLFASSGYNVRRNSPYAGGYTTQQYGKPFSGVHALQIEINRKLYLDEKQITRHSGFQSLAHFLQTSFTELVGLDTRNLRPQFAAE